MKLLGKILISFASSSIIYPLGEEILKMPSTIQNQLYILLSLCFSIYFIGAEIGFWNDFILDN